MSLLGAAGISAASGIVGNLIGLGSSYLNNQWASELASQDRAENYMYNEKAAQNADARTRALYKDFYSPEAIMQQYKAAGLSPSLMFGGTPGQGGVSGAQGAGASGTQTHFTPFMPTSIVEAAQIAQMAAETEKTKAETKNINQDTTIKEIETKLQEINLGKEQTDWDIINSKWINPESGEATSLFEMARNSFTFEEFIKDVRYNKDHMDPTIYEQSQTEQGMKTLRSIFQSANIFHRDIMTLSEESVNAKFQMDIIEALQKQGFAEKNAEAAVKELQASIDTNELTSTQKAAWNNLIDRMGKKGSTTRDLLVVLGMIISNFAGKVGIKVQIPGGK